MKRMAFTLVCMLAVSCAHTQKSEAVWQSLFDGKSLQGWQASDAPGTFNVHNGELVVHGPKSHLFYMAPLEFTDFELQLDVMTFPSANSGVYFHTEWQAQDWPAKGYEVQVNNSHRDPKRTAGLYGIADNYASVAQDDVWFTLNVRVEGKRIVTSVDGKIVADFTEPMPWNPPADFAGRKLGGGTFAIQGHDADSEVHYRNIKVRRLR